MTHDPEFARLLDEQAALRRIVVLVAAGADRAGVFAIVAQEVGRLLDADTASGPGSLRSPALSGLITVACSNPCDGSPPTIRRLTPR